MTGWMLGNRKRVAKGEESRGEKRKSPGLVQKSKRRGWGGCLNNWELCCGNVDEAGTFFFPPLCLVPLSEPTSSARWMCGRFVLSMPAEQVSAGFFED